MNGVHLIVSGRVQGVGFRAFVRDEARDLSIRGAVWNTRNGDVEILAGHESGAALADFELKVRGGPGFVANIVRTDRSATSFGPGFEIRSTV
ncbi:MAG: acylphosphatase [Chlorobia bacterium]|nr:acylphosphatase [Fimbriimonadaceae bacterium]